MASRLAAAIRRLLDIKSRRDVAREVLAEPEVMRARRVLRDGDRVLRELEMTERKR